MNPDENEVGMCAAPGDVMTDEVMYDERPDIVITEITRKWPVCLSMPLHKLSHRDAVDQVTIGVNELIERTVSADGFVPRTYQLIINGEVVTVDRVIAAQYFTLMFTDGKPADRRKATHDFITAVKRCYGHDLGPMIGKELTELVIDVNIDTLTLELSWEYTKMLSDNPQNVRLPKVYRYKTEAVLPHMGEMQRMLWLLGQASGQEIRHAGVLPVFTIVIRPGDNHIRIAKLNVPTKD